MENWSSHPHKYEFDLKNFFGSIDVERGLNACRDRIWKPVRNQLLDLCSELPKLPKDVEPYDQLIAQAQEQGFSKVLRKEMQEGRIKNFAVRNMKLSKGDPFAKAAARAISKGYPQGAAISPLLSVV